MKFLIFSAQMGKILTIAKEKHTFVDADIAAETFSVRTACDLFYFAVTTKTAFEKINQFFRQTRVQIPQHAVDRDVVYVDVKGIFF